MLLNAPFDVPQKQGEEIRIAQAAVKIYRGAAVGIILGVGYATVMNPTIAGMKFIGVAEETSDNSNGTPGTPVNGAPLSGLSPYIRVSRRKIYAFNQAGLTQAAVGLKAFFTTDDNTVSTTASPVSAGEIVTIDEQSGVAWVDITDAVFTPQQNGWVSLTGTTDAISPSASAQYSVDGAAVDAMTLAAPAASSSATLTITSTGAYAHTLTATGFLATGSASVNRATFAAFAGAGLTLKANKGKWNVITAVGITFS